MSTDKTETDADETEDVQADGASTEEEKKLELDVKIDERSACERHITVTVPREGIDRYYDDAFSEMMATAQVPGFRTGRAPRKLVESRFRRDVAEQVKGSLLMDSMSQVSEEHDLAAISEPDLDVEAIEIPDDGPMTFEFDLEVRPEFDLPNWKGLSIEKPVREVNDGEVDKQISSLLEREGKLVPFDGAAKVGDYVTTNLAFYDGENVLNRAEEEVIRIKPTLSFRDGKIEKFDKLMKGVKAGETRDSQLTLSDDAPNESLRGKKVKAVFEVLEIKKLETPKLTPAILESLGGFDSEGDLRDVIRENLERQLDYQQQQRARQQVTAALTAAADWDLPPDLLRRQGERELQRAVLELQRSGFSSDEIQAHENEIRQNSATTTARALKEHFILERLAEDESIEDESSDYDHEIALIAAQSGEPARRVRARLEKRDLMDTLRNQIIERKAIELILKHAKFKEVPFEQEQTDLEAIDQAAGGDESEAIPEATQSDEARPLAAPADHT